MHFFTYNGSTLSDLGVGPGGCTFSGTPHVNDSNVIVGAYIYTVVNPCDSTAAFYYDTTYHQIPYLSGDSAAFAKGISAAGIVIGYSLPSKHPWSYNIGTSTLTDLGLSKTGGGSWTLVTPTALNASGTIVGWAQ